MQETVRSLAAAFVLAGLWTTAAHAQEGEACSWSVGAAGNLSPAGRDWDLTTPGTAWSISPVLSQQCTHFDTLGRGRVWIGVDAVPTLRHSYRRLAARGSLIALMHLGFDVRLGGGPSMWWGMHAVNNVTAWGVGTRFLLDSVPRNKLFPYGLEARINWMAGTEMDVQAFLLVRVHDRWTGSFSEEEHLPERRWQGEKKLSFRTGFHAGPFLSWRLETGIGGPRGVELGTRVGALTNFFADTAVQPTGLLYVDIPLEREAVLQLEISGGPTMRDRTPYPMGGLAVQIDPWDSVLQAQLGVLVWRADRNYASIDAGMGWVW